MRGSSCLGEVGAVREPPLHALRISSRLKAQQGASNLGLKPQAKRSLKLLKAQAKEREQKEQALQQKEQALQLVDEERE